ncbi:MAG TPA: tetratricopeptide repeat protein, partial [Chthoniobacterales bacterium]
MLLDLEASIPHQTFTLCELAVQIDQALLETLRAMPEELAVTIGHRAQIARITSNFANRLSEVGRREEALAAGEETVDLYCELARARPDAFTPDLATSLNNLSSLLSAVGRREEALAAGEEAVDLYRELARARPDAFTLDLARALNNLANWLSAVGRREEALA